MRILLLAGAAALAFGAASPALAQDADGKPVLGAVAGGTSGAIVGGVLFGPLGAIIGGFTGAAIGADAAVPDTVIAYVGANPVEPIYLDTDLDIGFQVGGDIALYPVPDEPGYSYFYANGRAYIVDMSSGQIVYSPGFFVNEGAIAYVQANPVNSINVNVDLSTGIVIPAEVNLVAVPQYPVYSYAYLNGQPVIVDADSRMIIWIAA